MVEGEHGVVGIADVIAKIAKLRRLATSDNLHEAQAAAAAAARLADRYRLDEAEIEAGADGASSAAERERPVDDGEPITEEARVSKWRGVLLHALCRHYGCASYFSPWYVDVPNQGGTTPTYKQHAGWRRRVVGRASDTAVVRYLFGWLVADFTRILAREGKGRGVTWRNSWLLGAATGIGEQLAILRVERERDAKRAVAAGMTTALVAVERVEDRLAESREKLYELFPSMRKSRGRSSGPVRINGEAFGAGKAHGRSVHLGGSMGSGGGSKALGAWKGG